VFFSVSLLVVSLAIIRGEEVAILNEFLSFSSLASSFSFLSFY